MRTEKEVFAQFDSWAKDNDLVRVAVLTSSRTKPGAPIDFLSDYDIELYVSEIEPFQRDDDWLNVFGPIMVRWPRKPAGEDREGWITRLVLFKDGVRIDFQITDVLEIEPDTYEDGYQILIDKDDLTANLNPPTFAKYIIRKPTEEAYADLVNAFWWDATYVPKYLWRDELPFAAYMLGSMIRDNFLRRMIEWYIGMENDWAVDTGLHGRWFKRYLDKTHWSMYQSTFAKGNVEEHWTAFYHAVDFFRELAVEVGENLGYAYPRELDQEMIQYFEKIRNTQPDK